MSDDQPAHNAHPHAPAPAPAGGPAPAHTTSSTAFPIVGLGASAGGMAAFEAFFSALSHVDDCEMAFVVVQHLSPEHKSILAELVQRGSHLPVLEARDGMPVEPNRVYVIPPSHNLTLAGGVLQLSRHGMQRRPHLTVDHFFTSLAASQGDRAIGVVLSGTGSDGTLGIREIKGAGGLVLAQSPDSTEYDGMPRSAIATGLVDYVLAPAQMPAQLAAYARLAFDPTRAAALPLLRDGLLKQLCVLLRAQTGHDFSQYKETTLLRRIERRMALHQIEHSDEYLSYARSTPQEVEALFRDLLIGVTSFFRDPEAFELLNEKVIRRLVADKAAHEPIRVWVCACSTGEEAYSIAMLLYEQMITTQRVLKAQVFATDIDRQAIERARSGVYPASIAATMSEERLARFFTHDPKRSTYQVQKHIRDLLVFSEQDVIRDPPFSRLDLVSCRNLLIYLNGELQRKLIPLFHYALLPNGALFLGTSETVAENARLFHALDRKWKLYVRTLGEPPAARPALPSFAPRSFDTAPPNVHPSPITKQEVSNLRQITEKALLAHLGPAGVLINAHGQILHIVGRTGRFLEPADGDATMNIFAMAREGLRRELTIAVRKAVARKEPVAYTGLTVKSQGVAGFKANVAVRPVEADGGSIVYLVILEELADQPPEDALPAGTDHSGRIAALEREMRSKDEYLQATLEEMETAHEELTSTNEEMQSVNEELQSTNEELETSKEELQSVNEELSTVNAELQDKVADLSRANNDMNNLLAGTGVGTVFIDHNLRIARFTPAATQVINFIAADIGRPLEHVASNLVNYDQMVEDVRAVLETLTPREAEVQIKNGAWYLMRIRPYRTTENLIEGAVITLVDISERRKTEESLRRSQARLQAFINQAYAGVSETDLQGRFTFVNERLCDVLGYSRDELMQMSISAVTDPADLPRLHPLMEAVARGGPAIQVEKRYRCKNGSTLDTHERVSAIRDTTGRPISLLSLSFDAVDSQPGATRGASRP